MAQWVGNLSPSRQPEFDAGEPQYRREPTPVNCPLTFVHACVYSHMYSHSE